MANNGAYQGPNFFIPYQPPPGTPPEFRPIYKAFQSFINVFIRNCGVASRRPEELLLSANDTTAMLAANVHRFYLRAGEAINEGAAISLYNSAGTLAVRNANATNNTKPCHGYCSTPGGIANGEVGEVIIGEGMNSSLSGLTPASYYYSSTVNGQYTAVAPVAAGNLEQEVGFALSDTELWFRLATKVQH